jgi:hypothetical protein
MDNLLTSDERRRFDAWLYSPSVSSSNTDELIIAFKLGRQLHYPASRVLKALRGLDGLDREMVQQVEDFVLNEQSLSFTCEPPARLVVLTKTGSF